MKKDRIRSIRVDETVDDELQRRAAQLGISYSECVRRAVVDSSESHPVEPADVESPEPAEPELPKSPTGKLDALPDPLRGGLRSQRR